MKVRRDSRPRRRWLPWLALTLVGLWLGQIWWSYSARVRHGRPARGGLAEQLLADDGFEYRIWVAHPHQNLARARGWIGEPDLWLSALAQVAGVQREATGPSTVPTFGPFAVPPASGLAVGWSGDDEVAITARIRPALVVISRLAGTVAGNPWLGGGVVELAGRRVRVGWHGRDWLVASEAVWSRLEEELPLGSSDRPPPALGLVHYSRSQGPLPAGRLALTRNERGALELASWSASGLAFSQGSVGREQLAEGRGLLGGGAIELLLLGESGAGNGPPVDEGPAGDRSPDGGDPEAIAFEEAALEEPAFEERRPEPGERAAKAGRGVLLLGGSAISAGTIHLPSSAAVRPASSTARFELPVESLARRIGIDLVEMDAPGLIVSSLESGGLELAESVLPELRALIESEEPAWGLWLDPAALLELASTLRAGFDHLPLIGRREADRWRAIEQVLRPLARRGDLAALVSGEGEVLVVSSPPTAESDR